MSERKHILILVQNLPVPFDRRVWMESLALTKAGYKVSVISPCPRGEEDNAITTIDGIDVWRYSMPAPTESKLSFLKEFAYCYWQTKRMVKRVWEHEPFDVLQTCNPPDTFWAIARGYKRKGVHFVFDHHDLCPELYLSKFLKPDLFFRALRFLERWQYRTADRVIATNESYREVAITRGKKRPSDVVVVRSGPSRERFVATDPDVLLKRGARNLVVYLGVMGPQDGVDYALRAIHEAVKLGINDTHFTFIGSGDSYDELVRLRETLGLSDIVEFTGRISDELLRSYLSTADLALAPDPKNPLNDVSSMNKLVEYMAMGVPMVSFDLKESRCTAADAAVYVANDSERGMAEEMIRLLEDAAERARMGAAGKGRFQEALAWEYNESALLGLYDALTADAVVAARTAR